MHSKKNVTLEVRLPDTTKSAFMEQCRQRDRTASEEVRMFIDGQLAPAPRRGRPTMRLAVAAWIMGLAVGAGLATPSLARVCPCAAPTFAALDRNHDGVLSPSEFAAAR